MTSLIFRVIFSFLLSASVTFAEEGFVDDFSQLPEPVQAWEKRLFMPLHERTQQPRGTAFLIQNDGNVAIFISAAHAIQDPQDFVKSMTLRQGADWTLLGEMPFTSPLQLTPISAGIISPRHPDWKAAGSANDVGYIVTNSHPSLPIVKADFPGEEDLKSQRSHLFKKEVHYILGYPALASRYKKMVATQVIKPRWSTGQFVRKVAKGKKLVVETDADSVQGNSGGPIVNENGELIGVVTGGPHIREYQPYPRYYTYAAPLESVHTVLRSLNKRNLDELVVSCSRVLQ